MKKEKKEDGILVIQKYKGAKIGTISMIITLFIALACYIITLYLSQYSDINSEMKVTTSMIRDVLLAVISVVGTSLLTSVFIEKNRKNVDYTEFIANDIFASPEFYTNLEETNKEKMLKYLQENLGQKDPIRSEIYQLCREKIFSNSMKYYYEDFNQSISYYDYDVYSEKKIRRIVKIRSYDKKLKSNKLYLFSYRLSPTQGMKNFEVLSAGIGVHNEQLVIGKDIIVEKKTTTEPFMNKCGYIETYKVYLCKETTLYQDKDTIINIEYTSRVTDEDISAGFGISVPCRNFTLNFYAPSNYIVYAHAFGFLDSDNNVPNSDYKNNISVRFDKWLLPGEGVAVCVTKSREEQKRVEVTEEIEIGELEMA